MVIIEYITFLGQYLNGRKFNADLRRWDMLSQFSCPYIIKYGLLCMYKG